MLLTARASSRLYLLIGDEVGNVGVMTKRKEASRRERAKKTGRRRTGRESKQRGRSSLGRA